LGVRNQPEDERASDDVSKKRGKPEFEDAVESGNFADEQQEQHLNRPDYDMGEITDCNEIGDQENKKNMSLFGAV
jgi:hypothetical protein